MDSRRIPYWEHGLVFIPAPWTGCAQTADKTSCYWITHQGEELYLIPSFTYHHWESPTASAQDSGALEISNCRLVSSCIGICSKHWLVPYYKNSKTAQGPLLSPGTLSHSQFHKEETEILWTGEVTKLTTNFHGSPILNFFTNLKSSKKIKISTLLEKTSYLRTQM